jgi:hypothetical protein
MLPILMVCDVSSWAERFALSIMMCFFVFTSTPQRLGGGLRCSFSPFVCGGGGSGSGGGRERAGAEASVIGKSDRRIITCVISRLSCFPLRESLLDRSLYICAWYRASLRSLRVRAQCLTPTLQSPLW